MKHLISNRLSKEKLEVLIAKSEIHEAVLKNTLGQLRITNAELSALINVIESVIGDEDDGGQG